MNKDRAKAAFSAQYDLQTVSIPMVRAIHLALERAGHDPKITFARAGVMPKIMTEDRARCNAKAFSRLFSQAIRQLQDEAFGALNRPLKPGTFALLTQWMANGINLEDALKRAEQLFAILDCGIDFELVQNKSRATLRINTGNIDDPVGLFIQETMLTTLHRLAGWLIGAHLPLLLVRLGRKAPQHSDEYPRMFRAPIEFSSHESSLDFDVGFLDKMTSRRRHEVTEIVKTAPLGLLQHSPMDGSYYLRVKNILRLTSQDIPKLPDVAAELGLTEQTLRRKLQLENQSFRNIRNDFLLDYALKMLAQNQVSLDEISLKLGFSELSAFNRAFRQWTGQPPATYRAEFLN